MSPSHRSQSAGNERRDPLPVMRLKYNSLLWLWSDWLRHSFSFHLLQPVMNLMSLIKKDFIILSSYERRLDDPKHHIFLSLIHIINHVLPYLPLWQTEQSHKLLCIHFIDTPCVWDILMCRNVDKGDLSCNMLSSVTYEKGAERTQVALEWCKF